MKRVCYIIVCVLFMVGCNSDDDDYNEPSSNPGINNSAGSPLPYGNEITFSSSGSGTTESFYCEGGGTYFNLQHNTTGLFQSVLYRVGTPEIFLV